MTKAKVLLFDVETFPNVAYCWGKYDQNIIKFIKEWELASFSYKWLDSPTIYTHSRRKFKEKDLVAKLHSVFEQADVVVAHNGDRFDIPKAKAKFIQFNLVPPTIHKSVDTRKIARSQFSFNSNSLNDLGVTLGLGKKLETGGFDLWLGCMAGDKKSWDLMETYNAQDVILLEKIYMRFRSWMPNHPNLAILEDRKGCPKCSSLNVICRGYTATAKTKQRKMLCKDCNGWYTAGMKYAG